MLAAMPATLARLLAIFVNVFVNTSCRTSLRMFTGTCSYSSRACHDSCDTECFMVLDSGASKFQITIKEALHIRGKILISRLEASRFVSFLLMSLIMLFLLSFILLLCSRYFFSAYFVFHIQIVTRFDA